GKRGNFPVLDRVDAALQDAYAGPGTIKLDETTNSDGDASSAGFRAYRTYGQDDWVTLRLGADARYLEQHIQENFFFSIDDVIQDSTGPAISTPFYTSMPRAEMVNPGAFLEWKLPMLAYWDLSIGGRADWVHTTADIADVRV